MYKYYNKNGYGVMEYDFSSIAGFIDYIDSTPVKRSVFRDLASENGDFYFCKSRSLEEAIINSNRFHYGLADDAVEDDIAFDKQKSKTDFALERAGNNVDVILIEEPENHLSHTRLNQLINCIAEQYADKLVVGKINVDEDPELANQFGVMTIPTLYVFKNGEAVNHRSGAMPKEQILAMVR